MDPAATAEVPPATTPSESTTSPTGAAAAAAPTESSIPTTATATTAAAAAATAEAAATTATTPEDPNKVPDGVQPLFLSSPTCEIFNTKTGVDVTPEKPTILLKKEAIMADIIARRAISDFQPYKEAILVSDSIQDCMGFLTLYSHRR